MKLNKKQTKVTMTAEEAYLLMQVLGEATIKTYDEAGVDYLEAFDTYTALTGLFTSTE